MWRREAEARRIRREREQQYQCLDTEIESVKSLKYCYHMPMKMREGNVLQASVILSTDAMYAPHCIFWQVGGTHPTAMLSHLN